MDISSLALFAGVYFLAVASPGPAIAALGDKLADVAWDKAAISTAFKEVLAAHSLKMPQLAMPVRVLVMGTAQTPSVDAVLELAGKEKVLQRLRAA